MKQITQITDDTLLSLGEIVMAFETSCAAIEEKRKTKCFPRPDEFPEGRPRWKHKTISKWLQS